jgi:hypothetical protein
VSPAAGTLSSSGSNVSITSLPAGTYLVTATDSTSPIACSTSAAVTLTDPTTTPHCDWGVYDDSGNLITTAAFPVGSTGWGSRETYGYGSNGSTITLRGHCSSAMFVGGNYACYQNNIPATCITNSTYGRWQLGTPVDSSQSGTYTYTAGNQTSITLRDGAGNEIPGATFLPLPSAAVGSSFYAPEKFDSTAIVGFYKKSAGGAACVTEKGTAGTVSVYETQTFLMYCTTPTYCPGDGSCNSCEFHDAGDPLPGGSTTAQTKTRCE